MEKSKAVWLFGVKNGRIDIREIWKRDDIWFDDTQGLKQKVRQGKAHNIEDQISLIGDDVKWIDLKYDR